MPDTTNTLYNIHTTKTARVITKTKPMAAARVRIVPCIVEFTVAPNDSRGCGCGIARLTGATETGAVKGFAPVDFVGDCGLLVLNGSVSVGFDGCGTAEIFPVLLSSILVPGGRMPCLIIACNADWETGPFLSPF